jgi:hypothetical protein
VKSEKRKSENLGLAATPYLGYWFDSLSLILNSLFIMRDVQLSAAPNVVAKFATAPSRSAVLIFEAIH